MHSFRNHRWVGLRLANAITKETTGDVKKNPALKYFFGHFNSPTNPHFFQYFGHLSGVLSKKGSEFVS